jgi:hypothetical protein
MKKLLIISLVLVVMAAFCVLPFGREAQAIPRSDQRDANYRIENFISKVATGTDDDLFDVDGGPILITDFWGVVTTAIGATVTTMEINLDADSPWTDYDFSTAVAITSDSVGMRYVFTAANESVLTPLEGADGGATSLFKSWVCGEGMIEQNASTTDNDGGITWYMTYMPLAADITVTAQ